MNSMDETRPQLIVYTNSRIRCPYCIRAKNVLTERSYTFEERDIADPVVLAELHQKRPTARTVPQIFLANDTYIGGCDDLLATLSTLDTLIELNS
jgi:glutaredoxin 3